MKFKPLKINCLKISKKDIAADESLTILTKKDGASQTNLKSRQDAFSDLKKANDNFQDNISWLAEDGQAQDLVQAGQAAGESLNAYIQDYQSLLEAEDNFYQHLTKEEADLASFDDGISQLNQMHQQAQADLAQASQATPAIMAVDTSAKLEEGPTELSVNTGGQFIERPSRLPGKFTFDSGVDIAYPEEGVKGIYFSAHGMGTPEIYQRNIDLIKSSGLNSVVIDYKSDWGSITTDVETDDKLIQSMVQKTFDKNDVMATLEENQIYPIARITTFKDNFAATDKPEWSFRDSNGEVWTDDIGAAYLNPYNKEVWAYVVDIAKEAAKAGFKDIQFDYVRFPEAFDSLATELDYDMGDYAEYGKDSVEARQLAIADFLAYAKKELEVYGVEVSADIFGYVTTSGSATGIGQDYAAIAENVDAISAMIYPSHWTPGDFGIAAPDKEPGAVVEHYITAELALNNNLSHPPKSRPWLQDFTASYLPDGMYIDYNAPQVQAQIDTLAEHGVHEYLLWDASNDYSTGVNY